MRIAALTVCLLSLGLAGCAGGSAGDSSALAATTAPAPASAEPTQPPASQAKPQRRVNAAARGTSPPPQPEPAAESAEDGPMTREKASARCWMKYEDAKKVAVSLDKRADLVNQCVTDTMKTAR